MNRVICLIDGFNLYHAIDKIGDPVYKWCNYKSLTEQYLKSYHKLERVLYFTAYATWNPARVVRHKAFVAALTKYGIETVLGNFKEATRHCRNCNTDYISHEEKETDVNIATHLLHMAYTDSFDTAIIISADSDYASAIKLTRQCFPHKRIGVIIPVGQPYSQDLADAATFTKTMKKQHIKMNMLPDEIKLDDGTIIMRPKQYVAKIGESQEKRDNK